MPEEELCIECNEPTEKAGEREDSLFIDGKGPYCQECYDLYILLDDPEKLLIHISDYLYTKPVDQWYSDQLRALAEGFKTGKYAKVKP